MSASNPSPTSSPTSARFGCVIVNFKTATLALDAAASALGDGAARVVIVDNTASAASLAEFRDLLAGREGNEAGVLPDLGLPRDLAKPKRAPISLAETCFVREDATDSPSDVASAAPLTIVRAARNGGFSAGCNIGLRALLADAGISHFLLLNPDALVAQGALASFADRLADLGVGLCGATLLDHAPEPRVQAFGGARMGGLFHMGDNIGRGETLASLPPRDEVELAMTYPIGAAMACRRDFVERAGLMDERYFLYFEEADWTLAGAPQFRPGWAREAIVYHRYGQSTGSRQSFDARFSARTALADFHMTRSRLLFAAKWHRRTLALNRLAIGFQALTRLCRGRVANAMAVLRAAVT